MLTWSSSDDAVATVINGVVTPIAEGTAIITLSSAEGVSVSCDISVEKKSAFDFLADNAIENGDYSKGAYYYVFVNDYLNSTGGLITCAITCEPSKKEIILASLITSSDGDETFTSVTIDSQISYTYDVTFNFEYGGSSTDGDAYLYPSTFTGKSPLTFTSFSGPAATKSTAAELASASVALSLRYLEDFLTPNGYTLADLGFTSM